MDYQSVRRLRSESMPGIEFGIRRISFRSRTELLRAVRSVSSRQEFLAAGDSVADKLDAALLEREADELYLRWGLVELGGLQVDGVKAGLEELLECGPEGLCREILFHIKQECGLTEDETKN